MTISVVGLTPDRSAVEIGVPTNDPTVWNSLFGRYGRNTIRIFVAGIDARLASWTQFTR